MPALRKVPKPVPFDTVRGWASQISSQAAAISRLLGHYHYGPIADPGAAALSEAEKLDAARALMNKVLARHLTLLVGYVVQLNGLLEEKPPLSEADEAWIRRQLEGLQA